MNPHEPLAPSQTPGFPHVQPLRRAAEMKIRYIEMGKGHLKVYTRVLNGEVVMEAFTLKSLAECMGMAPGTVEGRYHRARLFVWKVDIPTGESRPVRGFPLAALQDVMELLTTRGAKITATGNEERIVGRQARGSAMFPLMYERHGKERYITIPALAEHYGRSTTTIRNKLAKAGLLKKGVNLNSPAQGGRPRRGFPVAMEDQLVDAIENGAQFFNEAQMAYNRVMLRRDSTAPSEGLTYKHTPIAQREAKPQDDKEDTEAFVQEIQAMLAKTPKPGQAAVQPEQIQLPAGNPPASADLKPWVERLSTEIWAEEQIVGDMRAAGFSAQQISDARRQAGVEGA